LNFGFIGENNYPFLLRLFPQKIAMSYDLIDVRMTPTRPQNHEGMRAEDLQYK